MQDNEKKLKALAAELAKGLNQFSRMLMKLTVETAFNAELTDHLGHEKNTPKTGTNTRNGYSSKTLLCDDDEIELNTPRDWENLNTFFGFRLTSEKQSTPRMPSNR